MINFFDHSWFFFMYVFFMKIFFHEYDSYTFQLCVSVYQLFLFENRTISTRKTSSRYKFQKPIDPSVFLLGWHILRIIYSKKTFWFTHNYPEKSNAKASCHIWQSYIWLSWHHISYTTKDIFSTTCITSTPIFDILHQNQLLL
jgi:hypothetical protein